MKYRDFLESWRKKPNAPAIKILAVSGKPAWQVLFVAPAEGALPERVLLAVIKGTGRGHLYTPTLTPDRYKYGDGLQALTAPGIGIITNAEMVSAFKTFRGNEREEVTK